MKLENSIILIIITICLMTEQNTYYYIGCDTLFYMYLKEFEIPCQNHWIPMLPILFSLQQYNSRLESTRNEIFNI